MTCRVRWYVSVLAGLLVACGKGPTQPGPSPNPPQLSCGAAVMITDVIGGAQAVSYPGPTVTNGAPPVSVNCTPPPGSMFPLGETNVTCTGVDALGRQATCTLLVTLQARQLATKKFLAFGDSMTEGENGRRLFPMFVDLPNAYPTQLQTMFAERFPSQPIFVVNAGYGGEWVTGSGTDTRLKGEIAKHQPQALLMLEGVNDLNSGAITPRMVSDALRDHIRTAYSRGVQYVFVSTLMPPGESGRNMPSEMLVQQTNAMIRPMVPASGAHLVDAYDLFLAHRSEYIEDDGLHLRPAGNTALATAFLEKILSVVPAQQLQGGTVER